MSRRLELYRPSNGSEGEWFEAHFCDRCEHEREWREKDENPCDIHTRVLFLDITDEGYPNEWRYDSTSHPICTKFKAEEEGGDRDLPRPCDPDPRQMVLIADPTEVIAGISPTPPTEKLSVELFSVADNG